jgi:hypothetical protein
MARPRTKDTYYAWSDLYNGGESVERTNANGTKVRIVESRNVIARGTEVSQSDIDVSDDEWNHLVESGSVRPYPLPDGADENVTPHRAVLAEIVDDQGEIDVNKLMALGATSAGALVTLPNPINPSAEEGKTLGEDKPAGA